MRKQIFCLVALLFFFAAKAPAQQAAHTAQVIVIRAGKLIDMDADRVRAKRMILVRGVKIETVGENLTVPAGATVINLSKMAVLPLKPGKYADISAVSGNCSMTSGCSKT
jgi:hypothetical protein